MYPERERERERERRLFSFDLCMFERMQETVNLIFLSNLNFYAVILGPCYNLAILYLLWSSVGR